MDDGHETLDEIENRMAQVRRALRSAMRENDSTRSKQLRAELHHLESRWEKKVAAGDDADSSHGDLGALSLEPTPVAALLPTREQVHQVLTLLSVPAAPKLITSVHGAFFSGELPASRLASLRRDEERSYRSAPNARPYYLCPALTADTLAPVRALLTVSTWPLEQRIVGAHSPRVDFLTAATKIASAVLSHRRLGESWEFGAMAQAERLLRSFAVSIPGALPPAASEHTPTLDPSHVAKAAEAELSVHADVDARERGEAAVRARRQLTEVDRLFGTRLTVVRGRATMGD